MLQDAQILLNGGRWRSAIDRAYYAMFHAAQAVLYARGYKPKTHEGTKTMFGEHVIKVQLAERRFGKMLTKAYDMRQASDYEVDIVFGEEDVGGVVKMAEEFVQKMKEIVGRIEGSD